MAGSIRRWGRDGWQLGVYHGVDGNGRPRWVTTVPGSRRHADAHPAELMAEVGHARFRGATAGKLPEPSYASSTPSRIAAG